MFIEYEIVRNIVFSNIIIIHYILLTFIGNVIVNLLLFVARVLFPISPWWLPLIPCTTAASSSSSLLVLLDLERSASAVAAWNSRSKRFFLSMLTMVTGLILIFLFDYCSCFTEKDFLCEPTKHLCGRESH